MKYCSLRVDIKKHFRKLTAFNQKVVLDCLPTEIDINVEIIDQPVIDDDNIITSWHPASAI